ncbi:hypothetical protein K440DRAFT_687427 [Wilcoxina mikolae CBS 423.85]|nr:hypothetical protein K440DRAFT_687427 [Wilcoxina mikolae CBS 423.85]
MHNFDPLAQVIRMAFSISKLVYTMHQRTNTKVNAYLVVIRHLTLFSWFAATSWNSYEILNGGTPPQLRMTAGSILKMSQLGKMTAYTLDVEPRTVVERIAIIAASDRYINSAGLLAPRAALSFVIMVWSFGATQRRLVSIEKQRPEGGMSFGFKSDFGTAVVKGEIL